MGRFEPQKGVPLAAHTSLQLGGPAEYFARLDGSDPIPVALEWAADRGLPVTWLGGGSNVVISDAGVAGLVLNLGSRGESIEREGDRVEVCVAAGVPWDELVAAAVSRNWSGVECLSGIPGQVGATPIQNVGAYGQEVADSIVRVEVYERSTGHTLSLSRGECGFGYRTSRFKTNDAARFVVLRVTFRLQEGAPPCLIYPEIAQKFAHTGLPPSLAQVRAAVLATRGNKSMLLDPNDENGRSCGSFFLNPALDPLQFEALLGRADVEPPHFPQPDGRIKVPAAWLIEQAGLRRGQRWGAVGISSKHTLALVCHAGATATELVAAAHSVRSRVAERFGVWLHPEPLFLGFGPESVGLPELVP